MGFGGLDCHFGELNVFVHHGEYIGNCISQWSRDPRSPQTILIITLGFGGLYNDFAELIVFVYH